MRVRGWATWVAAAGVETEGVGSVDGVPRAASAPVPGATADPGPDAAAVPRSRPASGV